MSLRRPTGVDGAIAFAGLTIAVGYWFVILTFPEFFFFTPFNPNDPLRSWELVGAICGWVSLSTVVPAILIAYSFGLRKVLSALPFFTLIWPIALNASQLTIFLRTGSPYFEYLLNYPIFILTDIYLPISLLLFWAVKRRGRVRAASNRAVSETLMMEEN